MRTPEEGWRHARISITEVAVGPDGTPSLLGSARTNASTKELQDMLEAVTGYGVRVEGAAERDDSRRVFGGSKRFWERLEEIRERDPGKAEQAPNN